MYMHVCIYIYIYLYICIYVYVCIYIYIYICHPNDRRNPIESRQHADLKKSHFQMAHESCTIVHQNAVSATALSR